MIQETKIKVLIVPKEMTLFEKFVISYTIFHSHNEYHKYFLFYYQSSNIWLRKMTWQDFVKYEGGLKCMEGRGVIYYYRDKAKR